MKKSTYFWHTSMMVAIVMMLWALTPAAAWADDEAYVRLSGTTLTFYYGSDKQDGDYELNATGSYPAWYSNKDKVCKVVFDKSFSEARPTSTYGWFRSMSKLTSIEGMEYLNTSEVTSMESMFCFCSGLASVDLSHFNTANVTTMEDMFMSCEAMTSIDCSSFNTSAVTTMEYMFAYCSKLTSVNLSSFNTVNIKTMDQMFWDCPKLTMLDLSSFKTPSTSWAHAYNMFNGCTSLTTIYSSEGFTLRYGTNIFKDCPKLKGAIEYDASKVDCNDAKNINYANYTTGYFTKKVGTNGSKIIGAAGTPLVIDDLTIVDGADFILDDEYKAKSASYTRQMSTKWGTLCLPFSIDVTNEENTCKFYSMDEVGTESVTLSKIESGTITAGTPVVICKKTDTQDDITVKASYASVVTIPATPSESTAMVGAFEGEVLTAGNGYFIANDKFYSVAQYASSTQGVKMNPYRAYIKTDDSSRSAILSIVADDEATGINAVDADQSTSAAEYYDAAGRRTQGLQQGLNIVKRGNKTFKVIIK